MLNTSFSLLKSHNIIVRSLIITPCLYWVTKQLYKREEKLVPDIEKLKKHSVQGRKPHNRPPLLRSHTIYSTVINIESINILAAADDSKQFLKKANHKKYGNS